jgi:hypothetical protein
MNTEQTEKSLGQWAYEAFVSGQDSKEWRHLTERFQTGWEASAQAVATEVLKRLPEWILVPMNEHTEEDDEFFSSSAKKWEPLGKGYKVGATVPVRRRIIPSQQPQLGSPKEPESCPACNSLVGWLFAQNPDKTLNKARSECHSCGYTMDHVTPPPAPRAEWKPRFKVGDRVRVEGFQTTFTVEYLPHDSKDAYRMVGGYNAKEDELTAAPWKLPEPPENKQWHRVDFTEEMLPEGWRPLLKDEDSQPDDEYLTGNLWRWSGGVSSLEIKARYRTQRPLPAPSTPQPSQSDTPISDAMKGFVELTERLGQERDAALARAGEAEKEFSRIQGKCEQLLRDLQAGKMPDDDGTRLIGEVRHIFRFRDQAIELEKELATLRASVPVWVPCNRVMPTEKDANAHGRVLFGSLDSIAWSAPWNEVKNATHWMALPPLHVETEEGENMMQIRAEFEEWAEANGYHVSKAPEHSEYFNIYTAKMWDSWQAALRSKKPS